MHSTSSAHYRRALTVAGSDCGGGAGIQADIKTFAALGCYGMSVVTALTAQNTLGVRAVHPTPCEFIAQQLDTVLEDLGADVVKIGMLFSSDAIATVARSLGRRNIPNIVLDPVMAAQSGRKLLKKDAVATLKSVLIPLCRLVTPNLPETEVLVGRAVTTISDMKAAAREIAAFGADSVLIKGGHSSQNPATDLLYLTSENEDVLFKGEYIRTRNNHGTGCTLSAAVAAHLAHGHSLTESVRRAKRFVQKALAAGASYQIGQGHGPLHHFFNYWK